MFYVDQEQKRKLTGLLLFVSNCMYGMDYICQGIVNSVYVILFVKIMLFRSTNLQCIFHYWSEWLKKNVFNWLYIQSNSEKPAMGEMEVNCCKKELGWEQGSQRAEQPERAQQAQPLAYLRANWRAFNFIASAFSQCSGTAENYQLLRTVLLNY